MCLGCVWGSVVVIGCGDSIDMVWVVWVVGFGCEFLFDDELVDLYLVEGCIVDIVLMGVLLVCGWVFDGDGMWVVFGFWDNYVYIV